MPSSNLDRAIRRARARIDAIDGPMRAQLVDLYAGVVRTLSSDLALVTMRIDEARAAGVDVNPDWLRRQDRYTRLMWQAEVQYERFAGEGMRLIEYGRVQAIRGGAAAAWEIMDASGIGQGFGATINTLAVENAMAATTTAPLRASLAAYGQDGAKTITDALVSGMASGRSPRAIQRDIERRLTGPYNKSRLEAMVRTESLRAYRAGLADGFKPFEHLGIGYRWVATKSPRTCLSCLYRDGKITPDPPDQQHVNCRCIFHLVPRGSTMDYESGEGWFARQSEDVQRKMIPSADAFTAYQQGDLTLRAFSGRTQSRQWGTTYYQRSGREALRHG